MIRPINCITSNYYNKRVSFRGADLGVLKNELPKTFDSFSSILKDAGVTNLQGLPSKIAKSLPKGVQNKIIDDRNWIINDKYVHIGPYGDAVVLNANTIADQNIDIEMLDNADVQASLGANDPENQMLHEIFGESIDKETLIEIINSITP